MRDYMRGISPELAKKYGAVSDEELAELLREFREGPEHDAILAESFRRSHEAWLKKPIEERRRVSKEKFVLHKEDIVI